MILRLLKIKFVITSIFIITSVLIAKNCIAITEIEKIADKYKDNGFIGTTYYDISTLNPIFASDIVSSAVIEHIFDGLLGQDEYGTITERRLADNWALSEELYVTPNPTEVLPNGKQSSVSNIVDYFKKLIDKNKKLKPSKQDKILADISKIETTNQQVKLTLQSVDELFLDKLKRLLKDIDFKDIEENLVILFHLRKGIMFHDGHEFDSNDVKFTYEAIVNPQNRSYIIDEFRAIKKIDIIDKYTLRITYSSLLSSALRSWSVGILPEHLLSKKSLFKEAKENGKNPESYLLRDSKFADHPIGTGPYKFHKRIARKYIILEKNNNYYFGSPLLQNIVYLVVEGSDDARDFYNRGIIDYYSIPYDQLSDFKDNRQQYLFSGTSYSTTYIAYNPQVSLFKDKDTRKALSMALNVEEIIKDLKLGQADRTTGLYPKSTPYYNKIIKPIKHDLARAKELLASKGWKDSDNDGLVDKDGKIFSFTAITNDKNRYDVLKYCQKYWKDIGINVSISFIEWKDFIKKITNGNYEVAISGLSMAISPDLYPIFHSSQTGPNQLNITGYRNARADRLMELIRKTFNEQRTIEYAHKLQKIIYEDQPYTFLFVTKWYAALRKQLVIADKDDRGVIGYKPVKQAPSGGISYHFNKWTKQSTGSEI